MFTGALCALRLFSSLCILVKATQKARSSAEFAGGYFKLEQIK